MAGHAEAMKKNILPYYVSINKNNVNVVKVLLLSLHDFLAFLLIRSRETTPFFLNIAILRCRSI